VLIKRLDGKVRGISRTHQSRLAEGSGTQPAGGRGHPDEELIPVVPPTGAGRVLQKTQVSQEVAGERGDRRTSVVGRTGAATGGWD